MLGVILLCYITLYEGENENRKSESNKLYSVYNI